MSAADRRFCAAPFRRVRGDGSTTVSRNPLVSESVAREDDGACTRKDVGEGCNLDIGVAGAHRNGVRFDDPTSADDAGPTTTAVTTEQSPGSVGNAGIVGRWERVLRCSELVDALEAAGLRKVAAPIVAGDYFRDMNAAALAEKDDLCEGAKPPFVHSHFFDAEGRFGSLDENESQVDEGRYDVVDSRDDPYWRRPRSRLPLRDRWRHVDALTGSDRGNGGGGSREPAGDHRCDAGDCGGLSGAGVEARPLQVLVLSRASMAAARSRTTGGPSGEPNA